MKIIAESHTDHVTSAHLDWLLDRFKDRTAFFIETVTLPEELPPVRCDLWGPATGEDPVPEAEVSYVTRGARKGPSRVVQREHLLTRQLTVIAGPEGDEPCVLYTAYGGPAAPREPWDETLDDAGKLESELFWSEHALCL